MKIYGLPLHRRALEAAGWTDLYDQDLRMLGLGAWGIRTATERLGDKINEKRLEECLNAWVPIDGLAFVDIERIEDANWNVASLGGTGKYDPTESLYAIGRHIELVRVVRELRPDVKLGIWGMPPVTRFRGLKMFWENRPAWQAAERAIRPLMSLVDLYLPSVYLSRSPIERMLPFCRAIDRKLALRYEGKPTIWFISINRQVGKDWTSLCDLDGLKRQLDFLKYCSVCLYVQIGTDMEAAAMHLQAVAERKG